METDSIFRAIILGKMSKVAHGALVPPAGGAVLKNIAETRGAPWPPFTSISEKFEPGGVRRAATARAVFGRVGDWQL